MHRPILLSFLAVLFLVPGLLAASGIDLKPCELPGLEGAARWYRKGLEELRGTPAVSPETAEWVRAEIARLESGKKKARPH